MTRSPPTIDPALSELIGRLIIVGIRGEGPGDPVFDTDMAECARLRVGGVVLFDVDLPKLTALRSSGMAADDARMLAARNIRSPQQTASMCDAIRSVLGSRTIVSVDQEGGAVARLSPARGFPPTAPAAAIPAMHAADRVAANARLVGTLRRAGITLNFAPCVDLARNPDNTVVVRNGRCFSADPAQVIDTAQGIIAAHIEQGVACCVKHFPGHGSSTTDTHEGSADITKTWDSSAELEPYRALLNEPSPLLCVMTGHLIHRGLDPSAAPASLSRPITTGLLRTELGFDGVVVTDSLDMRAISQQFGPGQAAVRALAAGADLVLEGNNLGPAEGTAEPRACPAGDMHAAIARAISDGVLSIERLESSVARVERLVRASNDARHEQSS